MADKSLGNLKIGLLLDNKDFQKKLRMIERDLKRSSKQWMDAGKNMSMAFTAPIVAAGAMAFKLASDYEESLNKVNVAFGDSAANIEKFAASTLKSYGISKNSALEMSALFGDMSTGMGLSQKAAAELSEKMVGLAGDLSSFKNMNLKEVQTALAGVFTGETESLKRMGIVMTEANLQAYALSKGIHTKMNALSQTEKVLLRYNYVTEMSKNAVGDFERTIGGSANQMRIAQESMTQLATSFGQILLPVITPIISKINDMLIKFDNLDESTKRNIVTFAGITAAIGPMLIGVGLAIKSFSLLAGAMRGVSVLALGGGSLLAVGAAGIYAYNSWKPFKDMIDEIAISFRKLGEDAEKFWNKKDFKIKGQQYTYKDVFEAGGGMKNMPFVGNYFGHQEKMTKMQQMSWKGGGGKGQDFNTMFSNPADPALKRTGEYVRNIGQKAKEATPALDDFFNKLNTSLKADAPAMGSIAYLNDQISKLKANLEKSVNTDAGLTKALTELIAVEDKLFSEESRIERFRDQLSGALRVIEPIAVKTGDAFARLDTMIQKMSASSQATVMEDITKRMTGAISDSSSKAGMAWNNYLIQSATSAGTYADRIVALNISMTQDLNKMIEDSMNIIAVGAGEMLGELMAGTNDFSGVLMNLGENLLNVLEQFAKMAIAAGLAALGIKAAINDPMSGGIAIAAGIGLLAITKAMKANLAKTNNVPGFASGGIVGGNSFYGDKILARLNSGELVLNRNQQADMFKQLNNPGFVQVNVSGHIDGHQLRLVTANSQQKYKRM
jgi:hypothetical protein